MKPNIVRENMQKQILEVISVLFQVQRKKLVVKAHPFCGYFIPLERFKCIAFIHVIHLHQKVYL
jgi:hypothetical protein